MHLKYAHYLCENVFTINFSELTVKFSNGNF